MGYRHRWFHGPYDVSRHPQPTFWAMDPAFVGADVAKEVAAVYFSNNRFEFEEEHCMPQMLSDDRFGIGIKAFEHIRRLDFNIDFKGFEYHICGEKDYFNRVYKWLNSLALIKKKN
jgi:hypothetical protein